MKLVLTSNVIAPTARNGILAPQASDIWLQLLRTGRHFLGKWKLHKIRQKPDEREGYSSYIGQYRHSAFHKKKRLELGYLVARCCCHLLVKEVATNQLNQWEPQTVQCNALSPRMQSFNLENIWKNCVNKKTVLPQFYPVVLGFRVFSCSL